MQGSWGGVLSKQHYCSAACNNLSSLQLFVFHSFSPSFSKLEEWLENLLMHLDIGLPLLSELEQLRRAFWQNHNHPNHSHNQDKTLDSHEQTHGSHPQRQGPDPNRHSDNANNHTEPNHFTQSQDQNSKPDGEQHTHDNPDMRTEHSCLSRECNDHSQDKSQMCCRSTSTDSVKNGSETYEHSNPSGQPQAKHEPSQPLQVNNSLLGLSNSPREICKALWDRSTEDSSFL